MADKHTPGPWRTDGEFITHRAPYGESQIACVDSTPADARLIAAAPDLLAALREVSTSTFLAANDARLLGVVRAAIAKAVTP